MYSIATGHLARVRTNLRGDSGAQAFMEEHERPFAIFWDESSPPIEYEDFGSQYCLQYLESGLEN